MGWGQVSLSLRPGLKPTRVLTSFVYPRHYSLEIVQHPIRARMCGFGDKVGPIPCASGSNASVRVGSAAFGPCGGCKAGSSERR